MHHEYWNDSWGPWGWIVMAALMVVFWGGLIWVAVTLIRRTTNASRPPAIDGPLSPPPAPRPSPQDVLADRLARGEIDPDDYHARIEALERSKRTDSG
jgi:putative membrane protein